MGGLIIDQALIEKVFGGDTSEREARIETLTPILGRQDAEIAVALDDDIRSSSQRDYKQAIAEAGGGFIRDRLREVSFARKILHPTHLLNTTIFTKKEV